VHLVFRPSLIPYRSNDGYHLYGCSGDGTICAISFGSKEFPELAAPEATQIVLDEYLYHPPKRVVARPLALHPAPQVANGFGAPHASTAQVNILQPRKAKPADRSQRTDLSSARTNGMANNEDAFSAAPLQPFASPSAAQASTARMFQDAHAAFTNGNRTGDAPVGESSRTAIKRKASLLGDSNPRAAKGRMMISTQTRNVDDVRGIRAPRVSIPGGSGGAARTLPVPCIQNILRAKSRNPDLQSYVEAQNAENAGGKNKVIYSANGQDQWIDYLPSAILGLAMSASFSAVACEDGSVYIYSPAGRQ